MDVVTVTSPIGLWALVYYWFEASSLTFVHCLVSLLKQDVMSES